MAASPKLPPLPHQDIVTTAMRAGQFRTLARALAAADLVNVLKGPGPFTVFAPTDQAFSRLAAGNLEALLQPENKNRLAAILTYHVTPEYLPAEQMMKLTFVPTVQGQTIPISAGNGVRVANATVTKPDIFCSNGVIHAIDAVLLPEDK